MEIRKHECSEYWAYLNIFREKIQHSTNGEKKKRFQKTRTMAYTKAIINKHTSFVCWNFSQALPLNTIINEVVGFLLLIHKMSTMFLPFFVLEALVFAHFNIDLVVTTIIHLRERIFCYKHD